MTDAKNNTLNSNSSSLASARFNERSDTFRRDIERLQDQYQKIIERLDALKEEVSLHRYRVIEALAEIKSIHQVQRSDFDMLGRDVNRLKNLEEKFKDIYTEACKASDIRIVKLEEIKKYNTRLLMWGVLILGTVSFAVTLVANLVAK